MDRRRQSIFGNLLQTCLLVQILFVANSRGCYLPDCIEAYDSEIAEQPAAICESIARAEECIKPCGFSPGYFDFERRLIEDREDHCTVTTTTQPPCNGQLPDFDTDQDIMELDDPVISYTVSDSPCFQNSSMDKRHCSMFTYSHIRQFSRNTIQTCSIGGQHTLIDHSELNITVTSVPDGQSSQYTNLQEIQIVIYPAECTGGQILFYTASASQELPLSMVNHDPLSSSVEVNVNSNGTVASILLPWLGTTIVIHRYAKHLGIVVHMPTEMAEFDNGLCGVGCSEDSQINAVEHIKDYCPSNQESSMISCNTRFSLLDKLQNPKLREEYLMACQIDVLNSQAYDVISVMSAVVTTCNLLPSNDELLVDVASGSGLNDTVTTFPPSQPLNCTHLSSQSASVQSPAEPVMDVDLGSLMGPCGVREPKGDALRECAMFTNSHLRPFDFHTIQTPSIPGTWVLLDYDGLVVNVTGVADPESPAFTKLEAIDITLSSLDCTYGQTLSYSVLASSPLPKEITYTEPAFELFLKPVQLDSDGEMTSIHIPMLNTTIVIRRDGGFLSIVARVPAQFVPSIKGLCNRGFPDYSSNKFDEFLSEQMSICHTEFQQVLIDCYNLAQEPKLQSLENGPMFSTYFNDVCQFDVLRNLSYDRLSMIRAIASDLTLLWDVGIYVYPSIELPVVATSLSPSPSSIYAATKTSTDLVTEIFSVVTDPLELSLPTSPPSLIHSSTVTSATLTDPSESTLSPSPSSSHLSATTSITIGAPSQLPSSPSANTEKETQSVTIPLLQETPKPSEPPRPKPSESSHPKPSGLPKTSRFPDPRPSGFPRPRPSGFPRPRPPTISLTPLEGVLSETPSSSQSHCYTLSLLLLLVALSLTLVFHLL